MAFSLLTAYHITDTLEEIQDAHWLLIYHVGIVHLDSEELFLTEPVL